ncbi:MAG: tape measure protein, partial [Lachnospiraceae bacterium]|nr:tape measure protein [Lachnospiraceae bacterium]
MPLLSFDVYSNYEEVIRLQREITTLQNKLKSFGPGTSLTTIRSIESQLQSASARMRALTAEAARSGAALELNIRKGVNGAIGAVNELQGKLSEPIMGLTQAAGIAGLGMFLNQVKNIRAEFQQMESSINTLVGEVKGKQLMEQLTDFAKVSPLDFKGTVSGAQMMLGFGIDADKVPRYLSAIGDVAMGNAQRFQSLTLAFSQMSAAGKLMGQDLNQMINAGFNPLQTMAEKTHKSIATLKKEMSDGKITAAMVQEAFVDATSEGGKYYQMSEKASQTLGGQMSMLQDATDLMFNDLGKGAEGMIMKVIQGATTLVENWKTVGRVMIGAIATFGIYKASAMAADFAEKKSAEEKSQAIIDGYTKQLDAMAKYEAAKRAQQGLDTAEDLIKPAAVDKLERGETLTEKDLTELSTYTQRLNVLQEEKERRDAVTKAMDEELAKLRELNGEKESTDGIDESKPKLDEDLQNAVELGADKEQAEILQQERDLLKEKAKIAGENLVLADEEHNKALANRDAAEAKVNALKKQKDAADALVEKLQEEHDLLSEDDLMNAPLDEYGEVTESIETLMKAEELEQAQKEASAKASELASAQLALESAEEQVNSTETALNTAYTEADTAVQNRNNAATLSGTTAQVTNTAAIQANSVAEATNTTATNANTASTTKNSIASKLATGWSKMKTAAHHLETAAINGVKRATDALKLAWATNPLGIILTVGAAIISVLTSIFGAMEDIEEETNKFGNEAKKTANEVDLLFAVLETTNKQSKVYQESLEKLTGIARDYGLVQKDEKVNIEDLIGLREKLIELIIEEGRQRQIANNIATLQDSIKSDTEQVESLIKNLVIETNSGGDRTDEWSEVASKLIAEDLERNANEVETLRQTIESYSRAKRDLFEDWSEEDQQQLDAAIEKYDKIVYGRANQVAQKYEGDNFALTVRANDMMGYSNDRDLGFYKNYTDAVQERNQKMQDYITLQKQSLEITEAAQKAPDPY